MFDRHILPRSNRPTSLQAHACGLHLCTPSEGSCFDCPAVLGHGSAVVGSGPQRPGTAGFGSGGNNMFASAGDSPGMPMQGQRRPGTANNMFANAGGGNRLGSGPAGNGMRLGLPRGGMCELLH